MPSASRYSSRVRGASGDSIATFLPLPLGIFVVQHLLQELRYTTSPITDRSGICKVSKVHGLFIRDFYIQLILESKNELHYIPASASKFDEKFPKVIPRIDSIGRYPVYVPNQRPQCLCHPRRQLAPAARHAHKFPIVDRCSTSHRCAKGFSFPGAAGGPEKLHQSAVRRSKPCLIAAPAVYPVTNPKEKARALNVPACSRCARKPL